MPIVWADAALFERPVRGAYPPHFSGAVYSVGISYFSQLGGKRENQVGLRVFARYLAFLPSKSVGVSYTSRLQVDWVVGLMK
jgi:hypothetical protein